MNAEKRDSKRVETSPRTHDVDPPCRLEATVRGRDGAGTSKVVDGTVVRVGSHPSNDLVVDDPEVSRFHLRLEQTPDGWRIRDEGSLNGTWVDDVRVRDADLPCRKAEVGVGGSTLEFAPVADPDVGARKTPEGLTPAPSATSSAARRRCGASSAR